MFHTFYAKRTKSRLFFMEVQISETSLQLASNISSLSVIKCNNMSLNECKQKQEVLEIKYQIFQKNEKIQRRLCKLLDSDNLFLKLSLFTNYDFVYTVYLLQKCNKNNFLRIIFTLILATKPFLNNYNTIVNKQVIY